MLFFRSEFRFYKEKHPENQVFGVSAVSRGARGLCLDVFESPRQGLFNAAKINPKAFFYAENEPF